MNISNHIDAMRQQRAFVLQLRSQIASLIERTISLSNSDREQALNNLLKAETLERDLRRVIEESHAVYNEALAAQQAGASLRSELFKALLQTQPSTSA